MPADLVREPVGSPRVVADTHVHLYECYDIGRALRCLHGRLGGVDSGAERLAFLAERGDCDAFADILEKRLLVDGFDVDPGSGDGTLVLRAQDGSRLWLMAGRQVVTAERIEILGLALTQSVTDGLSAEDTVLAVREGGGVPVVAWALGKWLGARGSVVRSLIDRCQPGDIVVGDSSLRPASWRAPALMRRARARGLPVVAGSDPLPFAGEETWMGAYVSVYDGGFDVAAPLASARRLLAGGRAELVRTRHTGTSQMLARWARNEWVRRRRRGV